MSIYPNGIDQYRREQKEEAQRRFNRNWQEDARRQAEKAAVQPPSERERAEQAYAQAKALIEGLDPSDVRAVSLLKACLKYNLEILDYLLSNGQI